MKIEDICVSVDSKEDSSWGFAKTKRILLRRANCEFGQSTFCARVGNFLFPNRDYTYEGFSGIIQQENWKFLDSIGFALINDEKEYVELNCSQVMVTPITATYFFDFKDYENENNSLKIEYYLLQNTCATLNVNASIIKNSKKYKLIVKPYCDIRFMYSQSNPNQMKIIDKTDRTVQIEKEGKVLVLKFKGEVEINEELKIVEWNYKISDGFRKIENGGINFNSSNRQLLDFGCINCTFFANKVEFQTSATDIEGVKNALRWNLKNDDLKSNLLSFARIAKAIEPDRLTLGNCWTQQQANAICARGGVLLNNFDFASNPPFLDAGCFWFRNPWMRDVFETIYVNFPLFYKVQKRKIRAFIFNALNLQRNGLIPNKLSEIRNEKVDYSSLDATLLCYLVAIEYCKLTDDKILKALLNRSILESITSFRNRKDKVSLNDNGLLSCPANFGWVDSVFIDKQTGERITGRVPKLWSEELINKNNKRLG